MEQDRSSGRVVLIVEDNRDAAESLKDLLEISGHLVTIAFDGRSGLALAHELKPEVILCDLGLPDIDGYQLARTLRTETSFGETLLIAITGYADQEHEKRALDAGFDAHLPKPPPIEVLGRLLGKRAG